MLPRVRAWLFSAVALAAGCSRLQTLTLPELEANVGWVAAIGLTADGKFLGASPLVANDAAARLEFSPEREPETVVLLGFDRSEQLDPPTPDPAQALTVASGCVRRLVPRVVRRLRGSFEPVQGSLPELTAPWLDRCPDDLSTRLKVDIRCPISDCVAVVNQIGCSIAIEAGCGAGTFAGRAFQGGLCVAPEGRACAPIADRWADYALSCGEGCELRFYTNPSAPWATVEHSAIYPGVPAFRPPLTNASGPQAWTFRGGYLVSLLKSAGGLIVLGRPTPLADNYCHGDATTEWLSVDPVTLSVTQSSTAPPCLRLLRRVSGRPEIFGVFTQNASTAIGVFDEGGRLLRSRILESTEPLGFGVRDMIDAPALGGLVVSVDIPREERLNSHLLRVDPETLASQTLRVATDSSLTALAVNGGQIVALDDIADALLWIGPTGAVQKSEVLAGVFSVNAASLALHPPTGRTMVASPADRSRVFVFGRTGLLTRAAIFDGPALAMTIRALENGADWMLLGGIRKDADQVWRGSIQRFSGETSGVLPSGIELGASPLGDSVEVDGTVIGLLPWVGEIVRIRLAP